MAVNGAPNVQLPMPMPLFRRYVLEGVLVPGHVLFLNIHAFSLSTYIATELSAEPYGLVAQEVLTAQEMYALSALLDVFPDFCPYDVLHAAITDAMPNEAQALVHRAIDARTLDQSMKPVRNVLSRCRLKLRTFHLDIRSVHGEGYYLTALR